MNIDKFSRKDEKQSYILFYLYLGPYSPTFKPATMAEGKFINLSNFKEISISIALNNLTLLI